MLLISDTLEVYPWALYVLVQTTFDIYIFFIPFSPFFLLSHSRFGGFFEHHVFRCIFLTYRHILYNTFTVNQNSYFCCCFSFLLLPQPSNKTTQKNWKTNADRMTQWDEKIFAQYKNSGRKHIKGYCRFAAETFLVSVLTFVLDENRFHVSWSFKFLFVLFTFVSQTRRNVWRIFLNLTF